MEYAEIINLIPEDKPIKRWELKELSGTSDRKVRKAIQEAREDGILIVNMQDGSGYQKVSADDLAQIRRQYQLNQARMISLSKQQKTLRAILKEKQPAAATTD
jgi:DNA-binding transcriptional regulator LsrR (DeoR family)